MCTDDLHLDGDVRQPEDRAVLAVAGRELADHRQSDEVAVERDGLVVPVAGSGPPQCAGAQMDRPSRAAGRVRADHVVPSSAALETAASISATPVASCAF